MGRIKITQYRSGIDRPEKHKRILAALGLKRNQTSVIHDDSPTIMGMVKKVPHLVRAWFEGGQMPINRRVPKRGFKNLFAKHYQIVNLRDLEGLGEETRVNAELLHGAGIIKNAALPVKLLADGQVQRAYTVEVDKASKAAIEAIQAAGGQVTVKEAK